MLNVRMRDRRIAVIRHQIPFRDIGDIVGFVVLGEEVIIGLVLAGTDVLRDRFIPLVRIGKFWVDVEDHAAKVEKAVLNNLADLELGPASVDCIGPVLVIVVCCFSHFISQLDIHAFLDSRLLRFRRFAAAAEQRCDALSYASFLAHPYAM